MLALITACIPILFLLALEGGLRVAGFGGSEPLFIPSKETPGFLEPNPLVASRLVADSSQPLLTQIDTNYFRAERVAGSLRIVVQGGSTAAGFPYGRWGSLAGMLQHRMRRAFPGREVEAVGIAMSAVNSYALLDFAEEVIEVQPDAVLIYAGHNEYLGILGVGSRHTLASNRRITLALQRARALGIFQLLQRVRSFVKSRFTSKEADGVGADATLMARIVGKREIPLGSALYEQGLAQFRTNMTDLLSRYREAGIPVYIGTLVSNERNQAPFLSGLARETDPAEWQSAYDRAQSLLAEGDLPNAQREVEHVLSLDRDSADAHYLRAEVLDAQGEYQAARAAYLEAKDRDLLRFRAPEAINAIIRELADVHGAVLVETQRAFAEASPQHIVGDELILEHLHPNAEGYFLLANAFYDALAATGLGGSWERGRTSVAQERGRNSITSVERFAGEIQIAVLEANWPFQPDASKVTTPEIVPTNTIERIGYRMEKRKITWTEAMQEEFEYYREIKDYVEVTRVALNLAETYPLSAWQSAEAGRYLAVLGLFRESATHLERAARLAPNNRSVATALAKVREQLATACGGEGCE